MNENRTEDQSSVSIKDDEYSTAKVMPALQSSHWNHVTDLMGQRLDCPWPLKSLLIHGHHKAVFGDWWYREQLWQEHF